MTGFSVIHRILFVSTGFRAVAQNPVSFQGPLAGRVWAPEHFEFQGWSMSPSEHRVEEASEARAVPLSGVRLGSLIANEAICEGTAVSHLAANRIQAQRSAFGIVRGVQMDLRQSAVGLASSREATLRESQAGAVCARIVRMEGGRAGFILAHTVEGKPRGVLASWAGLLIGVILGMLLGWLLRRLQR